MPKIDSYLEGTAWGDLHEVTKDYIRDNMVDVAKSYMYNYDNDFLEENGEEVYPVVFLKNGMYIRVDRADVWYCNVGGGVYIDFNDNESFERF